MLPGIAPLTKQNVASVQDVAESGGATAKFTCRVDVLCNNFFQYIYIFLENTLGECRINILIKKEERQRRLERGKMTTATQPGIEPGTTRFPGDCSSS